MIKKLRIGHAMHVVSVEHYVSMRVFSTALAENYYMKGEVFPERLSKKQAEEILKRRLFFWGDNGEIRDGCFERTDEEGKLFNSIYNKAYEFVQLKYPYLLDTDNEY